MADSNPTTGSVPQSEVKQIPTTELLPNPHNPRRLFDSQPMTVLENSIKKVGILVPLTVYFDEGQKNYFILDGERRWRMCKLDRPALRSCKYRASAVAGREHRDDVSDFISTGKIGN